MNSRIKTLLALTVVSLVMPLSAQAQFARGGNAPIEAGADDILNKDGVTILTGQVDVRQGGTRILSDVMKIYGGATGLGASSGSNVSRIEASGNFYYLTPEQEVRGNNGVYTRESDTFTVTGKVKVRQSNGSTAETDKLIYNVKSETIRFTGNCQGRGCSKGRQRLTIQR